MREEINWSMGDGNSISHKGLLHLCRVIVGITKRRYRDVRRNSKDLNMTPSKYTLEAS